MKGRLSGCASRKPSATPSAWTSGYELNSAAAGPKAVGPIVSIRSSIERLEWMSGSVASIHHASNPLVTSLSRICSKRSEEHTSELQSPMRISYAFFCLKTKKPTCYSISQHLDYIQ